jgi:hypothetical protein
VNFDAAMIGATSLLIKIGARQIVLSGEAVSPADAAPGVARPRFGFLLCRDLRASGDLLDKMF